VEQSPRPDPDERQPSTPAQADGSTPASAPVSGPPATTPPAAVSGPPATAPPARRFPLKWILVIVLASVLVLCVGAVGVGYQLYGRATSVPNSTPVVTVDSLLQAMFFDHSDADARAVRCDSKSVANLVSLQNDLSDREKRYNIKISVSWDSLLESSRHGGNATVTGNIIVATTTDGQNLRRVLPWQFSLVEHKGWRVCGASGVT
jgi:hypothetical protein